MLCVANLVLWYLANRQGSLQIARVKLLLAFDNDNFEDEMGNEGALRIEAGQETDAVKLSFFVWINLMYFLLKYCKKCTSHDCSILNYISTDSEGINRCIIDRLKYIRYNIMHVGMQIRYWGQDVLQN